jgi:hypothetical protein
MKDKVETRDTRSTPDSARLHYLDWLRVLAILMVFLFHAVHPFDFGDWQVKNTEQSEIISIILIPLAIAKCLLVPLFPEEHDRDWFSFSDDRQGGSHAYAHDCHRACIRGHSGGVGARARAPIA